MERRLLPKGAGFAGAAHQRPRVCPGGCALPPGSAPPGMPEPRAVQQPISVETSFAFSHFEQIKQRKLHIECWRGLGSETLILFTRKGLFFAWVTAAERIFFSLSL